VSVSTRHRNVPPRLSAWELLHYDLETCCKRPDEVQHLTTACSLKRPLAISAPAGVNRIFRGTESPTNVALFSVWEKFVQKSYARPVNGGHFVLSALLKSITCMESMTGILRSRSGPPTYPFQIEQVTPRGFPHAFCDLVSIGVNCASVLWAHRLSAISSA
jgi:hypothetical protein